MAYGKHYTLSFKSLKGDFCRFDILEKDYSGKVIALTGGGRSPVVHSWDASDILAPVWGSKCVVQYVSERRIVAGGLTATENITSTTITVDFSGVGVEGMVKIDIETVESGPFTFQTIGFVGQTAEELVLALIAQFDVSGFTATVGATPGTIVVVVSGYGGIESASVSVPAQSGTAEVLIAPIETFLTTDETKFKGEFYLNSQLQFTGFMVIDDFSAPYLTPPTIPTLTFTDGLALLNQVTLSDAGFNVTSGRVSISNIFENMLSLTNLTLPVRQYYNLFPKGEDNRGDDAGIDAFGLQHLPIKSFLVDDDSFDNCFTVFEKILKANCCVIMQQQGVWTIVRQAEYKRFNGNIPGSQEGEVAPVLTTKKIGQNGDLIPIERSQLKQYIRPTKKVTNTFNYRIPQLLTNSNLQRLGALIGTSTSGDNTYTDYELKDWQNQNAGEAFIRVITNTFTGKEVERYIYMPKVDAGANPIDPVGVRGVPIEVSKGDKFNFTYRAKAPNNIDKNAALRAGFLLVSATQKYILRYNIPSDGVAGKYIWFGSTTNTPENITISPDVQYIQRGVDISGYQTFNVWDGDINKVGIPVFPTDGLLYICLFGFNAGPNVAETDSVMKDFQFEYQLFINDSVQIVGQENKASQSILSKNESAKEIFIDDAPKFNIAGGLFKKDGSSFIRTTDWIKKSGETTYYNHGEVNAVDDLLLNSNYRTVFEGDFYGLIHPIGSFTIDGLEGLFVPYKLELDYNQNECRASLREVSKSSDPTFDSLLYNFRYLYSDQKRDA
jgi:hypothetical protein